MKQMNKRFSRAFASLAGICLGILLVLSGCSGSKIQETEEAAPDARHYNVYYTNAAGTALVAQIYTPESGSFDGLLSELLDQLAASPSTDLKSAFPDGVAIDSCITGVNNLMVDFDSGYLSLTNVQQVLIRAAVVKTLIQLPGVYSVSLTADGQPLIDEDGSVMPAMDEKTFIDTGGEGINSYHYVTLNLYFPYSAGKKLRSEERNLFYSSNVSSERLIAEQIIRGPENSELLPVTSPETSLLDIRITNDVCTVNLDSKFNEEYNAAVEPEAALYAFVNSICEGSSADGVRFQINGESDIRFRGQVSLDQTFARSEDMEADEKDVSGGTEEVAEAENRTEAADARTDKTSDDSGSSAE